MDRVFTAKLIRVRCRLEVVTEALEFEARRPVPVAIGLEEAEGDLELAVLLFGQRHLIVLPPISEDKRVPGVESSFLLVERFV